MIDAATIILAMMPVGFLQTDDCFTIEKVWLDCYTTYGGGPGGDGGGVSYLGNGVSCNALASACSLLV